MFSGCISLHLFSRPAPIAQGTVTPQIDPTGGHNVRTAHGWFDHDIDVVFAVGHQHAGALAEEGIR
jgi:hypothetical protein